MKDQVKVFAIYLTLGLLLYCNSLNNKFLIDDFGFLNNPVFSSTKFIYSQWNPYQEQSLGVIDSHEALGYYRPLAHMVLDICYAAFKNNYWEYHLLNIFLFVFASTLVYLLIQKLSGDHYLALLAGIFYLIHPINGIFVNYISANVFIFEVICMLATVLFLAGSLEENNDRLLYFLSLAFCFLSLFWHESGIMVPFYVGAFILLFRKDTLKDKAFYFLPYFLIVFSYMIFRSNFLKISGSILKNIVDYHMSATEYLATLCQVCSWYISKLFYPKGIVMQWAAPVVSSHSAIYALGACSLSALFLFLFIRSSKEKICQLGLAWFCIGFIPVSLAAFTKAGNGAQIEPHWFVFSSIGFFILAAYCCSILLVRMQQAGLILLFAIIFFWGSVSFDNNRLWADQRTYALYWSQQAPDLKLTYFYLASAYQKEGALNESEKYYRAALSGYPSDADIYNNLGFIDQSEGHLKNAELNYKMALKIDPYSANTYNDLGSLYYAEGRLDTAKVNFERSLILNPLLLDPRSGLVYILLKHSEYREAIDLCLKNLDIRNDDTRTLLLLISIYINDKDPADLKKYVKRFLSVETDHIVLTGLGVLLSQNNFPELALECFDKAIRVAPDYKYARVLAEKVLSTDVKNH